MALRFDGNAMHDAVAEHALAARSLATRLTCLPSARTQLRVVTAVNRGLPLAHQAPGANPLGSSSSTWNAGEYVSQVNAIGPLGLKFLNPHDDLRASKVE